MVKASEHFLQTNSKGDNVLHLGVLSDDHKTLQKIMKIAGDRGQLHHLKLQTNSQGLTPPQLAAKRKICKIVELLPTDQVPQSDNELQKLSESCPLFQEEKKDWFEPHVDPNCNISGEGVLNQYWKKDYMIGLEETKEPNGLASLSLDETPGDSDNAKRIKDVMRYLQRIEHYMRTESEVFKDLGIAFYPVGSLVEGTKIGVIDEGDCTVRFHELDGNLKMETATDIKYTGSLRHSLFENGILSLQKFYHCLIEETKKAVLNTSSSGCQIRLQFDVCQESGCMYQTKWGDFYR